VIVVAGHICLDVTPRLTSAAALTPGALVEAGPVAFSAGGAVANVGLALARLGFGATLLGLAGDDQFGAILQGELDGSAVGSYLSVELSVTTAESTSYSIVIDQPGRDRSFLHHSGCNDAFEPKHLQTERWLQAELLHFGYPPLMQGLYRDGGVGLAAEFARLRSEGVVVSLDMAKPDPLGESGKVDWRAFLRTVLPHVDLFLPSWEEVWYMCYPHEALAGPTLERLARVATDLLGLGPAVVGLKLGERGLYLRSAGSERVARAGRRGLPAGWADRELISPNMSVNAKGTTGAGDATIAGLLAAITDKVPLNTAATLSSAVGACSVEGLGSVAGIVTWEQIAELVGAGWARTEQWRSEELEERGWHRDADTGVLFGPADGGGTK